MASALAETWRGMGVFKWPILGLIVLGFAVAPITGPPSPKWFDNGTRDFAGGTVRLETKGRLEADGNLDFRVHADGTPSGQGRLQILGGEEAQVAFESEADPSVIEVSLQAPSKADKVQVILTMTQNSGSVHRVVWDLGPPFAF